jgi:hypothetical protein
MQDLTPKQARIVIAVVLVIALFGDSIYERIFNFPV